MSAVTKVVGKAISKTPLVGAVAKEVGLVPKKKASKSAAAPAVKPTQAAEPKMTQATEVATQQAAAMAARRRGRGLRSLLSPNREDAQTGLSNKLGG